MRFVVLKSLRVIAPIAGVTGVSIALAMSAHADVDVSDPLSDSTNAIFLGGTLMLPSQAKQLRAALACLIENAT